MVTPPTPPISQADKLNALPPITNLVPVKLDIDKANYSLWCYFFTNHCEGLELLDHVKRSNPKSHHQAKMAPSHRPLNG
ncbi:hypothetical protein Tco_0055292 [Tanacetum coccineum]